MRLNTLFRVLPFVAAALLAVVPAAASAESSVMPAAESSLSSGSLASSFGDALNQMRAQQGLGGLREDPRLTRAAQAYAEQMARHGHFSHVGPDGSTVTTRVRAAGCGGARAFAENIAWGQETAQAAFSGWASSAGHRDNMLGRSYGAFGLGQAAGMWVLVFADGC